MICPKCEYEYIEGIVTCPDCGSELINTEEFEGKLLHPSDWVIVHTCDEPYKADMLKANFEGANIETIIISQKDRSYPVIGNMSVVKLLVKKTDVDSALEIISDIDSTKIEDEE